MRDVGCHFKMFYSVLAEPCIEAGGPEFWKNPRVFQGFPREGERVFI